MMSRSQVITSVTSSTRRLFLSRKSAFGLAMILISLTADLENLYSNSHMMIICRKFC